MAIALRSSEKANNTGTDTHTVTAPTGAASGDVLVGFWYCPEGDDWTAPSGWTEALGVTDLAYGSFIVARYVLAAAPAGSYAATTTGNATSWGIITAWTGVNTTTPEDVAADSATQDTVYSAPSLTTATNDAVLINFYGEVDDELGTEHSGQTRIDRGQATVVSYLAAYEARAAAGATGVRTLTGYSFRAQCVSYALRPAAAVTGTFPNALMLVGVG